MKKKQESLSRIREKTVYLLGAGFSAGTGAPTLARFIPDGLAFLKKACSSRDESERKVLKTFTEEVEAALHHYVAAAEFLPNRLVNLEDLFCLVDLRKQYNSRRSGHASPRVHETTLKKFVVEVLRCAWAEHERSWKRLKSEEGSRGTTLGDDVLTSKAPPVVPQRSLFSFNDSNEHSPNTDQYYNACAYEAFLSQVLHDNDKRLRNTEEHADVIVTLNYDLVIERKLAKISKRPVFYGDIGCRAQHSRAWPETRTMPSLLWEWPGKGPMPLPLFKIHGSINWQVPPNLEDASSALTVAGFWEPGSAVTGSDVRIRRIPIIPPTWRKTAASNTVFARLLGAALHHMKRAERIVIVGYSLPNTDAYFRYLLAEALGTPVLPTIELWDVVPEDELKQRVRNALGDRIERVAFPKSKAKKGFIELVCSRTIPNPA